MRMERVIGTDLYLMPKFHHFAVRGIVVQQKGTNLVRCQVRGCIQKFPDWVDNEI
jgi:hypothetical protein